MKSWGAPPKNLGVRIGNGATRRLTIYAFDPSVSRVYALSSPAVHAPLRGPGRGRDSADAAQHFAQHYKSTMTYTHQPTAWRCRAHLRGACTRQGVWPLPHGRAWPLLSVHAAVGAAHPAYWRPLHAAEHLSSPETGHARCCRGCKVPIWASSIGPSRHALLAGGLLGHGTSGEIVAASSIETGADRT